MYCMNIHLAFAFCEYPYYWIGLLWISIRLFQYKNIYSIRHTILQIIKHHSVDKHVNIINYREVLRNYLKMDIRRYFPINNSSILPVTTEIAGESSSVIRENPNVNEDPLVVAVDELDENVSVHQNGIIDDEDFEFVGGKRRTAKLLYLKKEKCLYMQVTKDRYGRRFKCYSAACPARAIVRDNGVCEKAKKNFLHVDHKTHCDLRREFLATNKIKETCANVETLCSGASQNVSVRDIYDKETIRYA